MKKIIVLLYIILLVSCVKKEHLNSDNAQIVESENTDVYQKNFHEQQYAVKNRLSGRIDDLLNKACEYDSNTFQNCMILVVRSTDCQSCIDLGHNFMKLSSLTDFNKVHYIVGSSTLLKGRIDIKNGYTDLNQTIVEKLGFFKTPALIAYNKKTGIMDTYMIPVFDDSVGMNDFSKAILSHVKNN